MPKKLLKHGKFYKRGESGTLVVYRAGAIVDVTENQAKNNPDQFVDLPAKSLESPADKGEVVKEGKPMPAPPVKSMVGQPPKKTLPSGSV